jgi:hypothetical protein
LAVLEGVADRGGVDTAAHGPKLFPSTAGEPHHLHLLERRVIARAGVGDDARDQHRDLQAFEGRRLLHHIVAGQVVTAFSQDLDHRVGDQVTENRQAVVLTEV